MQPWPRVALIAAFFVAVAAFMYGVKLVYEPVLVPVLEVATPFLIAFVLAFLLDPLADVFQRYGASRDFAVAIVGLLFLVVFVLGGFVLVPRISDQATDLANNYSSYSASIQERVDGILKAHTDLLQRFGLPTDLQGLSKKYSSQLSGVGMGAVSLLAGFLGGLLSRILWFIIIPLSTLWFLRDLDYLKAKAVHFAPERHRDRLVELSSAIGTVFGKYVRGMLTVAILFSLVTMLVLTIARLNYGLIIGAVAGLFYLVPYVGVAIIASITGLAALVQPGHGPEYAIILAIYLLFQAFILFDLVVTPKVVGGSVGVHPVLALFSLALGARLFGVVGMVLAVPVAASLQVAIGQIYPKMLEDLRPRPQKDQPPKRRLIDRFGRKRAGSENSSESASPEP